MVAAAMIGQPSALGAASALIGLGQFGAGAAIAPLVGIELVELEAVTCCGAGDIHEAEPDYYVHLNARILAYAEATGCDTLMTVCNVCTLNLRQANFMLQGDSDLLAASAKLLGETNLTYADIEKPKDAPTDDDAALQRKNEEYRQERKRVQRNVQWTLIFFAPVLFAAFGIFRWRRRETARDHISLD